MDARIEIGCRVRVKSLTWGEGDRPLYLFDLIGKTGRVVGHDNDRYTPPNIVEIEGDQYFLPSECLEIINY